MTQNINYSTFVSRLKSLENWDPNSQLLKKDLTLEAKPDSLGFCSLIKLFFSHARAKNAVAASKNLNTWSNQFKDELENDKETLLKLRKTNAKIYHTFVAGGEREHILKSKSKRKTIQKNFFETRNKIKQKNHGLNSSKIDQFLKTFNPATKEEAIAGYQKISSVLDTLTKKQANDLLIKLRKIKKDFKGDPSFNKAHLKLCKRIRARFFAERLAQNREDLNALLDNFKGSETGKVYEILEKWTLRLEKNKPIDIPKWYHCTKRHHINKIIHSGKIKVLHKGAYKGAFVSTQPESLYGAYCIALGSNIETKAKKPPLISHVSSSAGFVLRDKAMLKKKNDDEEEGKLLSVWAGFRQSIALKKPEKSKDPLGYYETTNFLLLGESERNYYSQTSEEWLDGLSSTTQKDLKARKIEILTQNDFQELVRLVNQTLEHTLPYSWKDAYVTSTHDKLGNHHARKDDFN